MCAYVSGFITCVSGLTENGVVWIHGDLVLGGVADEPLGVGERHVARCGAIALVIGDNLDLSVLENSDAGVGRAKIDTNCGCLSHCVFVC